MKKMIKKLRNRNVVNSVVGTGADSILFWLFAIQLATLFVPQARVAAWVAGGGGTKVLGAIFLALFSREMLAGDKEEVVEDTATA